MSDELLLHSRRRGGDAFISNNPTGGASAWVGAVHDSGGALLTPVPPTSLCVASDEVGGILAATISHDAPVDADRADGLNQLSSVSCPSTTTCVPSTAKHVLVGATPQP